MLHSITEKYHVCFVLTLSWVSAYGHYVNDLNHYSYAFIMILSEPQVQTF